MYIFFTVFLALALLATIGEESDMLLNALDDYVLVGITIVTLILIYVMRNKDSTVELRKQSNWITILFVIALIVQIFAIFQELHDPADFGNGIPSLMLILFVLVNRFV